MRLSGSLYAIVAIAVVISIGAYLYFTPKSSAVSTGTVIVTPKPSTPPTDKKVLLRRAIAGDTDAQCRLAGRFMSYDLGLPYDPDLAYYWASLSASKHDPCGINNLAILYENGTGVSRDEHLAIQLYELAASLGDVNAMANLGRIYYYGDRQDGVDRDLPTAMDWYTKAGDHGDFTSLRQLGEIYGWGEGVPININRSSAYLLRANPIHDGPAAYDLGWLYYRYYPREERCERTVYWLRISADLDDPNGQNMLGILNESGGCGIKRDASAAAYWFRKALDRNPIAEQNYAWMLWNGELGAADKPLALRYARDAALRGNESAMYMLGVAYDHGLGVLPNSKTAWAFFNAAADRGEPDAVSIVAMAYFRGFRVTQDRARGFGMLLAVESLGVTFAPGDKARLLRQLTPDELSAARRIAFAFAAKVKENTDEYPWLAPPHRQRVD